MIFGILVFTVGILDGVDGSIARLTSNSTRFGGIFDSTIDRFSDALVFFGPALREMFSGDFLDASFLSLKAISIPMWFWAFLVFIGAYMTSYIRARANLVDKNVDMDVGLLGRSERLFLLVIASLANCIPIGMVILVIITNVTALYRLKKARDGINEEDN